MGKILQMVRAWIPLLWTILALVLILVLAVPSKRTSGNVIGLGYLVGIDASKVITETGAGRYQGLPDSHDFSKHKDFFVLYLSGYCSGKKLGNEYKPDFCSRPGEMFDQYNVWKTWGVNLAENRNSPHGIQRAIGVTAIKSMPGAILIVVKLLVVALALTTLLGFISPLFHWAKVLVTVLSTVSSLSAFAVASMCESLYPMLANRVDNYHPTAQGVMTSFVGRKTLAGLWILSVLSLLATILWIIDAVRSKEILGAGTTKGGAPMFKVPKIVRRTTGGLFGEKHRYENTSYDTLRPSSRGPSRGPSRSGSQEYLTGKIDHRRSHSREPSVGPPRGPSEDTTSTVLHDVAQLLDEKVASQSRYEPFRHRDLS